MKFFNIAGSLDKLPTPFKLNFTVKSPEYAAQLVNILMPLYTIIYL